MACTKFEYVKLFENHDTLLNNTYIVIRIDGSGFTKFSKEHNFDKPNDIKALNLMNQSALHIMNNFPDLLLSYGESDEYSFVFKRETKIFERRKDKIISTIVSMFSSYYVYNFEKIINKKLIYLPSFDCRAICYPTLNNLKDYFRWRQADTHINNLYNTCFWNLVKSGISNLEAEKQLNGTLSDYKNELLFEKFKINYSKLDPIYRKGSVIIKINDINNEKYNKYLILLKKYELNDKKGVKPNLPRNKTKLKIEHIDIIQDSFWDKYFNYLI